MENKFEELNMFYKAQKARSPWAIAWAIVRGSKGEGGTRLDSVREMYRDEISSAGDDPEAQRSLAAKIAGGIQRNPWNRSSDDLSGFEEDFTPLSKSKTPEVSEQTEQSTKLEKKISPALEAIAGWFFGGDVTRGIGQPTAAQQREFERQIQQAMRRKGRRLRKESAMNKMQTFFNAKDNADTYVRRAPLKNGVQADLTLEKRLSIPPRQGEVFDPISHRWVKPENRGQTIQARGGKKRLRATGTGAGERSVSGHGKGVIRGVGAGRKHKGETDVAQKRREESFRREKREKRDKKEKTENQLRRR
tara:strand:- start:62 stop:976 length:915 start_codon:yes stop_codon:yes gene_type:complete